MDRQPTSVPVALGRASLLQDPLLIKVRFGSLEPISALKERICALGISDETAALNAAQFLIKKDEKLMVQIDAMCSLIGSVRLGLPILREDQLARRLARIVDPDALFPFFPGLKLPEDELFCWNAVPLNESGRIEGLMGQGSLETHIHLGGTLPPVFYWLPLMGGELAFESIRALASPDRGQALSEHWMNRIGSAAWLRLEMGSFLARSRQHLGLSRPFPWLPYGWEADIVGQTPTTLLEVRRRLLTLTQAFRRRQSPDDGTEWPFTDPFRRPSQTSPNINRRRHYASGERKLLNCLGELCRLHRLKIPPPLQHEHSSLEHKLLTYIRIRNSFHRLMVHDRGSQGLLRFVETFKRRGFLYGQRRRQTGPRQRRYLRMALKLERARMTAALDSQLVAPFSSYGEPRPSFSSLEPPLRRIEMRVSVPKLRVLRRTLDAWLGGILDHLGAYREPLNSQVGIIFHFLKRGTEQRYLLESLQTAERICWLLRSRPTIRPFVVGIDAAGLERESNPRAFSKPFYRIQEETRYYRASPGKPEIRLGWTFHVGEDVEDLVTGLRHIDETISFLLPQHTGGRLGHALALADDPERFYRIRNNSTNPVPGTHLLDLVWAWGRLTTLGNPEAAQWLQERILLKYQETNPQVIGRCYQAMGFGETSTAHIGNTLSEEQLLAILYPLSTSHKIPQVNVPDEPRWIQIVTTLQNQLIKKVARRRICIEANPTSNLIIGKFGNYRELPFQRLIDAGIPVSLNTDDPGLFMTTLPGEFSAMYDSLDFDSSHQKRPHQVRRAWLEARMRDAEQSTFLGRHVPAGKSAIEWIRKNLTREGS